MYDYVVWWKCSTEKTNSALNHPKLIESYLSEKFHNQRCFWEKINYACALTNIEHLKAESEFCRLLIDLTTNFDDLNLVYGKRIIVTEENHDYPVKTLRIEHKVFLATTTIEEHHRSQPLVASTLYELAGNFQLTIRLISTYMTQLILGRLLVPSSTSSPLSFVYRHLK